LRCRYRWRWRRLRGRFVAANCPRKDCAHIIAVIVLARGLGICAKHPLIDADVPVVAEMRLDDVVQFHARRWPLGEYGRDGRRADEHSQRDDADESGTHE